MRVLLLTDGIFPFVIGGMQKHSYYLSKYLPQNDVKLTLVHCVNEGEVVPSEQEVISKMGYDKEGLNNIKVITLTFPVSKFRFPGHYLWNSWLYSKEVFNNVKNDLENYDFVYAKGFTAWRLMSAKKRGLACPPIGVKFHGLNMFQKAANIRAKLEHLMFRPFVRFNMFNSDFNFSYGGKITDIIAEVGVPRSQILEFPTGIEANWFNDSSTVKEIRTFLFIGRYERLKGVEELNIAIKNLMGDYEFNFLFVGPIPEEKKIRSSKVKYLGKIMDETALRQLYQQADIVVCPSYSEGMPNVIMEGIAQSLAVIATDVGATREMVSKENGWLLGDVSVSSIQKALINAIELNVVELDEKKRKSFDKAQQFLWTTNAEKIVALLKTL